MDENFFKRVVEESHDEIFVCDKNGKVIYCNKAFEKNYGIKIEDILGKTPMYMAENGYTDKTPIPEVIKTKKKVSMEQETMSGRKIIITATPIFDENDELEYIIENCRDITELNNIKNKLENTKKEFEIYKNEVESLYGETYLNKNNPIIGGDLMKSIINIANQVARTNVNVLLLGESGTGKSTLARYLHQKSDRVNGPFITVNCTTISQNLLEAELFGYVGGAFTGASSKGKIGIVELADGGTLFLDEIGELPSSIQAKFLQLIQEKTFTPVGSLKSKKVDIRIISATNRNLYELVKEKKFREDLYYRINVIEINLPSLRDRREDLPRLINYYVNKYLEKFNMKKSISNRAIQLMLDYEYPGNIRELQNIIQSAIIRASNDIIDIDSLPNTIKKEVSIRMTFDDIIEDYESKIINETYKQNNSSYKLAKALNISQSKASRLIRKYVDNSL